LYLPEKLQRALIPLAWLVVDAQNVQSSFAKKPRNVQITEISFREKCTMHKTAFFGIIIDIEKERS